MVFLFFVEFLAAVGKTLCKEFDKKRLFEYFFKFVCGLCRPGLKEEQWIELR